MRSALCSKKCPDLKNVAREMLNSKWAQKDTPGRANKLADCMRDVACVHVPAQYCCKN